MDCTINLFSITKSLTYINLYHFPWSQWNALFITVERRKIAWFKPSSLHALFYKQRFFSIQPQCCLTFSWIELDMLFMCCLIHKSIIVLRRFLYLLYLYPCQDLDLFMLFLCDLFFIFIFISVMISPKILWIQIYMFFCLYFRTCPMIKNANKFKRAKV